LTDECFICNEACRRIELRQAEIVTAVGKWNDCDSTSCWLWCVGCRRGL